MAMSEPNPDSNETAVSFYAIKYYLIVFLSLEILLLKQLAASAALEFHLCFCSHWRWQLPV